MKKKGKKKKKKAVLWFADLIHSLAGGREIESYCP